MNKSNLSNKGFTLKFKKYTSGFTLIELLISIAIIGVLIGASFYVLSSFWRAESGIKKILDQNQSVRFVMERIINEARRAEDISSSSISSKLILEYDGFSISYDYANKKVRRRKGGGSSYLTEENKISGLEFYYPVPKLVKISINTINSSFESQAFVRN